jgi:hypothetical protein
MDIDIWVLPSPDNADAVLRALRRFGAPLHNAAKSDFEKAGTVFQIGVAPRRIDIITAASGLEFEDAFKNSIAVDLEGVNVHIPSVADLILNKRASGRTKDLADAEALAELDDSDPQRPGASAVPGGRAVAGSPSSPPASTSQLGPGRPRPATRCNIEPQSKEPQNHEAERGTDVCGGMGVSG